MKIVFFCYGGTHASPVAAAIYLGQLPESRPSKEALKALTLFDRVDSKDIGLLRRVGTAANGDEVYVIGCRRYPQIVLRTLKGFAALLGRDPEEYFFFDVRPSYNWVMHVGGYSSRTLGLVDFGRPLVTYGTWLAYPRIVRLVDQAKAEVVRAEAARRAGTRS